MQLVSLTPPTPFSAAAVVEHMIQCCNCDKRATYGRASEAGWKFNPAGAAFKDYYCTGCVEVACKST